MGADVSMTDSITEITNEAINETVAESNIKSNATANQHARVFFKRNTAKACGKENPNIPQMCTPAINIDVSQSAFVKNLSENVMEISEKVANEFANKVDTLLDEETIQTSTGSFSLMPNINITKNNIKEDISTYVKNSMQASMNSTMSNETTNTADVEVTSCTIYACPPGEASTYVAQPYTVNVEQVAEIIAENSSLLVLDSIKEALVDNDISLESINYSAQTSTDALSNMVNVMGGTMQAIIIGIVVICLVCGILAFIAMKCMGTDLGDLGEGISDLGDELGDMDMDIDFD